MEKGLSDHSIELKDLGAKLEEAKAYPIWVLIVFEVSIVLNGILIYILISKPPAAQSTSILIMLKKWI